MDWEALIQTRATRRDSLIIRIIKAILAIWDGYNDWDNETRVKAQLARTIPILETGLRQVQLEALQFQTTTIRELNVRTPIIPVEDFIYPRSGVSMWDAYQRPARDAASAQREGKDPWEAFENRVRGMVEIDALAVDRDETDRVQSFLVDEGVADDPGADEPGHDDDNPAVFEDLEELRKAVDEDLRERLRGPTANEQRNRRFSNRTESGERIKGWRRVIRPELSQSGTCGLCVVAATRFYKRSDLDAIHDRCKCVVLPYTASHDPGLTLNREDFRRIYNAAGGSTRGEALKKLRVSVREHGELGSILSYSPKRGWEDKPYKKAYERKKKTDHQDELRERIADADYVLKLLRANPRENAGAIKGLENMIRETRALLRAA